MRRVLLFSVLAASACLDFEKAYNDCFAAGNCHEPAGPEAPKVLATEPANRATGVDPNTFVSFALDRPMNQASVTASLEPGVGLVAPSWDDAGTRVTFTPSVRLAYETQYTMRIGGMSVAGGALEAANVGVFTVKPQPLGPAMVESTPARNNNVVPLDAGLSLSFSAPVTAASFSVVMTPPTLLGTPLWNAAGTAVSYPAAPLYKEATTYSVQFEGTGSDGLVLAPPTSFTFQTVPDGTPPTVDSVTPVNGQVNVSPTSSPSITFSEPMNAASLAAAISMQPGDAGCQWRLEPVEKKTVTCSHVNPLSPDAGYSITVSTAATDLAALPLVAPFTYGFTTGPIPDTTAPTVVGTVPADNATGIDVLKTLSVTFSEPMAAAATQGAVSVTAPTGITPTAFSWSSDGRTMTFTLSPAAPLETQIQWQVGTGATDLSGNALATAVTRRYKSWRFVTTTLVSDPNVDGEVRKYPSGGQTFQGAQATVGSTGTPQIFRAFFSFDMTAVYANAPIIFQDATLNLFENGTVQGNIFGVMKGPIIIENVEYGTTLENADFDVPAISVCTLALGCPTSTGMVSSALMGNQASGAGVHATELLRWFHKQFSEWDGSSTSAQRNVQFRVRSTTEPLSSASTTDYIGLHAGESVTPSLRPALVVRYYAP